MSIDHLKGMSLIYGGMQAVDNNNTGISLKVGPWDEGFFSTQN